MRQGLMRARACAGAVRVPMYWMVFALLVALENLQLLVRAASMAPPRTGFSLAMRSPAAVTRRSGHRES